MIRGNISHQKLDLASCKVVSDSIDYLTAEFTFSPDWYGAVKVAHFSNGSDTYDIILTDDRIRPEDHLNLSAGNWNVYLHGTIGDTRITTDAQLLRVHRTGILNGEPLPEIPLSAAEQILHKAANAEELAQSVVDRADAGEFIGPAGPEGPPGKVDEGTISEAVAEYLDKHPVEAPVQSVNGQTGNVQIAVPAKVSQLQNDAGYLTQHQDISGKQDKIADLATIRAGAAKGATALQSESDPTVPSWAKQPSKPSYTAAEVHALPDTTPIPEAYDDTEVKRLISGKYTKPSTGIPASDLAAGVIPAPVTDDHINDLIDAKLTPIDALADDITEVVGA